MSFEKSSESYMAFNDFQVYSNEYCLPVLRFERLSGRATFTKEEARSIGHSLGIDWDNCSFDIEQFRIGLCVELEHGTKNPKTNITDDDPEVTGKITLAHLEEFPDYYVRLTKMENEAEEYWGSRRRFVED